MKAKAVQNVKYDSTTGKMYEELGATAGGAAAAAQGGDANQNLTSTTASVLPSSSSTSSLSLTSGHGQSASASDYLSYQNYQSSYPYSQMTQVNPYMSSFASAASGYGSSVGSSSHQLNPYDR